MDLALHSPEELARRKKKEQRPVEDMSQKKLLVQAAAGGVGSFALQYGRHVYGFGEGHGTASAANAELLYALGATRAIDYTAEPADGMPPPALSSVGMHVVLDPVAWRYETALHL